VFLFWVNTASQPSIYRDEVLVVDDLFCLFPQDFARDVYHHRMRGKEREPPGERVVVTDWWFVKKPSRKIETGAKI
jgi:hypothetical protein